MSETVADEAFEMKDEDNFSNSPECSSDDEDVDEEKVAQLQKEVDSNPYTYDLHVQLISMCRTLGDLEKLRNAREKMNSLFPLTPELWLEWLADEKGIATTQEQKDKLVSLFERALKDYPCVSIWLDYVQFSIGTIGDTWEAEGLENVRQTFERALTSVGIHVTQGYLIWEAFREFETVYLQHIKNQNASAEDIEKQVNRIYNIFKRQLSIPLIGMDKTYAEFKELQDEGSSVGSSIDYSYKKALQKLNQLQQYEDALYTSETPHYEEYKQYIQFEKEGKEPVRVQNIYERALIENCLKDELWSDYAKYVDNVIKIPDMSLPVHERAVRNCPWSVHLWASYGRALERYDEPHEKIIEVFENALGMGFTKAEDFKELWLAYLDYLRRRIDKKKSESQGDIQDEIAILDVYDRAATQMKHYFWGSDSEYNIMSSWIFFIAKYKKDIDGARKLWKELIDHGHKEQARVWLDFANFERRYGDATHYRKALFQALSCVSSWQETFVDLLITFEREEGTLETFERSLAKCETQMQLINEKRLKKLEEAADSIETNAKKRRPLKNNPKNENVSESKTKSPIKMDSEGFKIPPLPDKLQHSDSRHNQSDSDKRKRKPEEEVTQEPKKRKVETSTTESHGTSVKHDPTKDDRTVFLSNLSFDINEKQIGDFFSQVGEIEEIRLVKNYSGKSKGFCYVVYKSEDSVKSALAKDREMLEGRPVLVSPCEDRKNNPSMQPKFKFATGLEKNKLFIKGLPFSTTKEDLENMFKEHGALKEVRLVTYRNGHSKGIAYVEYIDAACAANAVVKMDGTQVMENVISVAISNPPPRKPKNDFSSSSVFESLGGGGGAPKGPRGRGRTQVSLLPRSVMRPLGRRPANPKNGSLQNGQNAKSMDTSEESKPLSNSDFAKMLKK